MRRWILGLALAGCAAAPPVPAGPKPGAELVPVARALSAIDAAEHRGELAKERDRLLSEAASRPKDPAAQFLVLWASPRNEETWSAFKGLSEAAPATPWGALGMARIYVEWGT